MSIFLIDKIKPINNGKFPVYEDVDGYGGFQVRTDTAARNSVPAANRKEGMLVYTVVEQKFWQLKNGIANSNWQEVTLGSGGGGGGAGITPGAANTVAVSNGSSVIFSKIVDGYVDDAAAIAGTKINPDFGSQDISTLGGLSANDGYFMDFVSFAGNGVLPSTSDVGVDNGGIYFDSNTHKFKIYENSTDGWVDLLGGGGALPPHNDPDEVLVTYGLGSGGSVFTDFRKIGNLNIADNADIEGTKIIPHFGSQDIIADGYFSVVDGYFGGAVYFEESSEPSSIPPNNGSIYFNQSDGKFKAYENSADGWVDLIKATVYADNDTPGLVQLSGDLDGYQSSYDAPRVGKINGVSVPSLIGDEGGNLTIGNLLQANGPDSLAYGPLNLEGGDGYITGRLPIASGGAALNFCEFSFNSSVIKTKESVWETVGAAIFDPALLAPTQSGTRNRTIKLKVLLQTTGPEAQVMLYNRGSGAAVPLRPLPHDLYMKTTDTEGELLVSDDITSLLTSSIYEVRIRMDDSGTLSDSDHVICLMSKLYVEWV
jgi:hypothetical protein